MALGEVISCCSRGLDSMMERAAGFDCSTFASTPGSAIACMHKVGNQMPSSPPRTAVDLPAAG